MGRYEEALAKARELHGTVAAGRDFLAEIFPELRESEDERIRRHLIDIVETYWGTTNDPGKAADLAWLERQKESTWTEEDESFRKHSLPRILNPKGWTMEQIEADRKLLKEFVERQKNKWLEKKEEQKPALTPERIHPKFAVGDTVCRPMWSDHTIREIYIDCNDPVYVCVNDEGLESHISFSEQDEWERKEQKPAEWSEEDEKLWKSALWHIKNSCGNGGKNSGEFEVYHWLKFLPERFNLQPKQEWSDEDKEMVRRAIFYTEQYRTNYGDTKESEECFNWLLDLHRNIRPPFHWKPSEEQMNALYDILHPADPVNLDAVKSLYNDLKKLL